MSGEGQGGVAGFAKGGAAVRARPTTATDTMLSYEVKAQVGGKIAQLGARLIDATAKQMADAFFDRFAAAVRRPAAVETAAPKRPSTPPRTTLAPVVRRPISLLRHDAAGAVRPAAASPGSAGDLPVHPDPAVRKPAVVLRARPATVAETAALLAARATSPTRSWPPPSTWRWRCAGRCSWRASPAPARPRSPRCWRPGSGGGWCGCNATTAWTWRPPPTSGTTPASSWRSASPRPAAPPIGRAGERHLQPRIPARPPAAVGDRPRPQPPAVLLIDELDRADEPFEAFLLELLADFQLTIPGIRHRQRRHAAGGGDDLEPHPRGA